MTEDRSSLPLIIGVTAGLLGALLAVTLLYPARNQQEPEIVIRDAREIIAQCHETIKEIESSLEALRQPAGV